MHHSRQHRSPPGHCADLGTVLTWALWWAHLDELACEHTIIFLYNDTTSQRKVTIEPSMPQPPTVAFNTNLCHQVCHHDTVMHYSQNCTSVIKGSNL